MTSSYLFSLCTFSIAFASLKAQTETCPFIASGIITNGINAELIRTDTGFLLGIRVSWSWLSSVPTHCFLSPEVQLSPSIGQIQKITLNSTSRNNSIEFSNLDCKEMYTPIVTAHFGDNGQVQLRVSENGNALFFGSLLRSPPPVLPQVCVGPSTSTQYPGQVNISWDPLPCHLQNGADITSYIILYTPLPTNVTTRISSSSGSVECFQEFDGLYLCVVALSLISNDQAFSIQVGAQSGNGEGPFSDPISILSAPVSNTICTSPSDAVTADTQSSGDLISTSSDSVSQDVTDITSIDPKSSQDDYYNTSTTEMIGPFISEGVSTVTQSTGDLISITSDSVTQDVTDATSIDPKSSQIDYTSTTKMIGPFISGGVSIAPFISGGIIGIFVLLGSVIVLVALVLFMKRRKQHKPSNHMYASISDLKNKNSIEMVPDPDPSESNTSLLALKPTREDIHDRSENERDTPNKISMKNVLYEPASEPKITDFQPEVHATAGEQVTLRVNFTGIPKPTITWTFKGTKMEGDYATELGTDGSLLFVCVETKHAGRYQFEVSNTLGSVKGCVALVVQEGEEEDQVNLEQNFESNPVTQEEFGEYVASLHSYNNNTFILQYESLVSGEEGKEVKVGRSEVNQLLNRFRNITAYDDHRISLMPLRNFSECQNNYINASYIDGFSQANKYIASQGPLPITVTDFWHLVWQEKVRIIAMVTNVKEGKTKKCEQYWPDETGSGQSYGPFSVTVVEQNIFAHYIIRTVQLVHTGEGGSSRKVTQYHFTSWPDHSVPEYTGPILNYLRRIKAQHKPNKGPILVHCSAGVGRTGTLIAIDIALSQASKEKQVDIPKIIVNMRRQRMKMVQTVDQYAFIHDAVLETLICGDTQIPASDIRRALDRLKKADKNFDGMTGFNKQFQVLDQVSPNPTEIFCDWAKRYPNKNRSNNFLPPDNWRVVMKGDVSSYIHASFANGYKQRKGFIIAQSPMVTTVKDFLKMLYERECGVVVMLCGCEEGGVEMCAQYWPATAGTLMKSGEFMVSTVSITDTKDGFIQRAITITDPKSGQVQKLTQFQVDQWSADGLCSNTQALVHVIDQMGVAQRRTGNKPIVVHGSDTVSRIGIFCSLVNAIEMCKTEGVVDVFQVVKALRIQKPGAVLTAGQYQFIFDLVLLFLDSFSIYSNFK